MTAKHAADALVTYDIELAAAINAIIEDHSSHPSELAKKKANLIRETAGTWTLSLAAAAANVPEERVLDALSRYHLQTGSKFASRALGIDLADIKKAKPP